MSDMQVGTEFVDRDQLDDSAAKLTGQIMAAHRTVNDAIASGAYQPFRPAVESPGGREAATLMMSAEFGFIVDLMSIATELFERGDCDDMIGGFLSAAQNAITKVGMIAFAGWSEEQHAAMVELLNEADRAGVKPAVVQVVHDIIHPIRDRKSAGQVMVALDLLAKNTNEQTDGES